MQSNTSSEELRAIFSKPGAKTRTTETRRAASTPWPSRMTLRRPRAGDAQAQAPVTEATPGPELVDMAPPRSGGALVPFLFRTLFFAVLTGSTALLALSMGAVPEPMRSFMENDPTRFAVLLFGLAAGYAALHRLPGRTGSRG